MGIGVAGPFLDPSALQATISEMGCLSVQVGNHVVNFIPKGWEPAFAAWMKMLKLGQDWMQRFMLS